MRPGTADGDVRRGCTGIPPLTGLLDPWQVAALRRPQLLRRLVEEHGSPLNLLHPAPFRRNAVVLAAAARRAGLELGIYFARKANKAIVFVDEARRAGLGVDVAGEHELEQALACGVSPARIIVTAGVKPAALLDLIVRTGVTVSVDGEDELRALSAQATAVGKRARVALRLAPVLPGRPPTRFGIAGEAWTAVLGAARHAVDVRGVHFHVAGYRPDDRVHAIGEALVLADELRAGGHTPGFVDIGGGFPVSYLASVAEWEAFLALLRPDDEPLPTYDGHRLEPPADGGSPAGGSVYPYHQPLTGAAWLERILDAPLPGDGGRRVARALVDRGLELRCEPGRALLDGCGMTLARVAHRKRRRDGVWMVGLEMNRTQCRSGSEDHLVDPLLVPADVSRAATGAIEAYLAGAFCVEHDLITWRRLRFPEGVAVGDLVAFPNTAGYLMHLLESASHQMPLARNVVLDGPDRGRLDEIDRDSHAEPACATPLERVRAATIRREEYA